MKAFVVHSEVTMTFVLPAVDLASTPVDSRLLTSGVLASEDYQIHNIPNDMRLEKPIIFLQR